MALKSLPAVAAEKRAQAAVARSILLRILAADGLSRLDAGRPEFGGDPATCGELATYALGYVTRLLGVLNDECDRLDA